MGRRIGRNPSQTTAIERRRRLMGVSYGDPDFPVPPGWPVGPGGPGTPPLPPIANLEAFWDTRYKSCESSPLDNLLDLTGNQNDLRLGNDGYSTLNYDGLVLPGTSGNYAKADEEFHRGSVATYYDENGIVREASNGRRAEPSARDKNFVDGERTLLLEGSRTNLLLWSEDLDVSPWVKGRTTVSSNVAVAPNGQGTADKVVETVGVNEFHQVQQAATIIANATLAYSIYAKKEERSEILMKVQESGASANAGEAFFNLDSKTVGSVVTRGTASEVAGRIEDVGNGWCRCTLIVNIGNGATAVTSLTFLSRVGENLQYDGDGVSGLYLWGAQIEDSVNFASSYIPTANLTVKRPADKFAKPFLNEQQELTVYVRGVDLGQSAELKRGAILAVGDFGDATADPRLWLRERNAGGAGYEFLYDNGTAQATAGAVVAVPAGSEVELRGRLRADGQSLCGVSVDGGAEVTGTAGPASGGLASGPFSESIANIGNFAGNSSSFAYLQIEVFSGDLLVEECRAAGRGDLFSYRPGDEINYWEFEGSAQNNQTSVDGKVETAGYSLFRRGLRDEHYVDGVRTTLLEGQRTNICQYSERLANFPWSLFRARLEEDTIIAPDGTLTAEKLIPNTDDSVHTVGQNFTMTADGTTTVSIFAKAGELPEFQLRVRNTSDIADYFACFFDLTTGTVGTAENGGIATGATGRIVELIDGWYRCILTGQLNGATTTAQVLTYPGIGGENLTYAGNDLDGMFFWGGQIEDQKESVSSYIKTPGGSSVTRPRDEFAKLFPQDLQASTYYTKFVHPGEQPEAARVFWVADGVSGSGNPRFGPVWSSGLTNYRLVHDNGTTSLSGSGLVTSPSPGDTVEIVAQLYADGSIQIHQALNGGAFEAGTKTSAPTGGIVTRDGDQFMGIASLGNGVNACDLALSQLECYSGVIAPTAVDPSARGNLFSYRPGDAVFEPSVTGDIDVVSGIIVPAWPPASNQAVVAQYSASVGDRAHNLQVRTNSTILAYLSDDGGTSTDVPASVSFDPPVGEGFEIRQHTDFVANVLRFFWRPATGGPWLAIGTANITSDGLFNSTQPIEVGQAGGGSLFEGTIQSSLILNGIEGETVHVADFSGRAGQSEFDMPQTGGVMEIQQGSPDTNTPIWLPYCDQTSYLWLPGLAGNYASVPNEAAFDITGDIDLRCEVALDDWATGSEQGLISKYAVANDSYLFRVRRDGAISLVILQGNVATELPVSRPPELIDGKRVWIRATYRQSDGRVQYFTSPDGIAWSQVGADQTYPTSPIDISTAPVEIGTSTVFSNHSRGLFYRAQIFDGIEEDGGSLVLDADFTLQSNYDLTMRTLIARTAQTVTIQRAASGYKSVVVFDRGVYALATDDYLFANLRDVPSDPEPPSGGEVWSEGFESGGVVDSSESGTGYGFQPTFSGTVTGSPVNEGSLAWTEPVTAGQANWGEDIDLGANLERLWFEYYVNLGADYWHANQSNSTAPAVPIDQTGAAISAGTTTLTVTGGSAFTAFHEGRLVTVPGAGAGGADLETRIDSVTSATEVEVVDAAGTTVSGATLTSVSGWANHKWFGGHGLAYNSNDSRAKIMIEAVPSIVTPGDTRWRVGWCVDGANTVTFDALTDDLFGLGKLVRGQWGRIRGHFDVGSAFGANDGVIKLWVNDTVIYSRNDCNIYPAPGVAQAAYFDTIYAWNTCNYGLARAMTLAMDSYKLYNTDPGW